MKNQKNQSQHQNLGGLNILKGPNALPTKEKMKTEEVVVAPPPHVWEKIEQALNMQQQRHKTANEIIMSSFRKRGQNFSNFS